MILIIQGPPAAGKTTLARQLSNELGLPHIGRDNITEWLMNVAEKPNNNDFLNSSAMPDMS